MQLTMPKPCHENWDKMDQVTKGRHCKACATTVIDFSLMTDGQILETLKNNKTHCGRFSSDQLNRQLLPARQPKWYSYAFLKYVISGAMFFKVAKVNAQTNPIVSFVTTDVHIDSLLKSNSETPLQGKMISFSSEDLHKNLSKNIKIIDEENNPIAGVSLLVKGAKIKSVTNKKGIAKVSLMYSGDADFVKISKEGYVDKTIHFNNLKDKIVLKKVELVKCVEPMVSGNMAILQDDYTFYDTTRLNYTLVIRDKKGMPIPNAIVEIGNNKNGQLFFSDKDGLVKCALYDTASLVQINITSAKHKAKQLVLSFADFQSNKTDIVLDIKKNPNFLIYYIGIGLFVLGLGYYKMRQKFGMGKLNLKTL